MATQKGRNWSSGDIVTAANLSSIERGVSAMAEEYTPTTWANGNTVTAAALNNIEQGIANAGGGSSDFSTAQVTIVNNTEEAFVLYFPNIFDDKMFLTLDSADIDGSPVDAVLYKNACDITYTSDAKLTISVSGSATTVSGRVVTVTGDCTITIS